MADLHRLERALTYALGILGPSMKPVYKSDADAIAALMDLRAELGIKTEASTPPVVEIPRLEDL
jgi:hypothetical protein